MVAVMAVAVGVLGSTVAQDAPDQTTRGMLQDVRGRIEHSSRLRCFGGDVCCDMGSNVWPG